MLNKEQIIEICKKSSFTASTFGYSVMVVPQDEFSTIAEQILSLLKSNSDTPPQLNKHDVSRSADTLLPADNLKDEVLKIWNAAELHTMKETNTLDDYGLEDETDIPDLEEYFNRRYR